MDVEVLFEEEVRGLGWPSKTKPNISAASRSCQFGSRVDVRDRGDVRVPGAGRDGDLEGVAVLERVEVVLEREPVGVEIDAGDVAQEVEVEFAALVRASDEGVELRGGDVSSGRWPVSLTKGVPRPDALCGGRSGIRRAPAVGFWETGW